MNVHVEQLDAKDDVPTSTGRSCDVVTKRDMVACELPTGAPGMYWLKATARDRAGRDVSAAHLFRVLHGAPPPPPKLVPAPPPPPPEPVLSFEDACHAPLRDADEGHHYVDAFVIDGDSYDRVFTVGETARLCLHGDGDALLTLEREGVLRREVHHLGAVGKIVEVPITPELFPNVSVALDSVAGRTAPFPPASGKLIGLKGSVPHHGHYERDLHVRAPERKLSITIATAPEYKPGAEVVTSVTVRDGAGHPAPAQVTLWAVDQAVIELMPFGPPDVQAPFDEERRSDVFDTDTREHLLIERLDGHRTKAPSIRSGATSIGNMLLVGRAAFRPTAWFLPSVITGPDGVATVKTKLPDNVTTWKVFAVAATVDDRFGSAEAAFRTNEPLMLRPSLPRFLRVGDSFDATAIIDSSSKAAVLVKVSRRTTGALSAAPSEQAVAIPANGHVPVHFAVDARSVGKGTVTFHVEAPREHLVNDVTTSLDVSAPATLETIVLAGEAHAPCPIGPPAREGAPRAGRRSRRATALCTRAGRSRPCQGRSRAWHEGAHVRRVAGARNWRAGRRSGRDVALVSSAPVVGRANHSHGAPCVRGARPAEPAGAEARARAPVAATRRPLFHDASVCVGAPCVERGARGVCAPKRVHHRARLLRRQRAHDGRDRGRRTRGMVGLDSDGAPLHRGQCFTLVHHGRWPSLFYQGALRYARKEPPQAPLDQGMHVARTMRVLRADAPPVATTDLRVGDYVEVDVVLASPVPRDLVVLDDPCPRASRP